MASVSSLDCSGRSSSPPSEPPRVMGARGVTVLAFAERELCVRCSHVLWGQVNVSFLARVQSSNASKRETWRRTVESIHDSGGGHESRSLTHWTSLILWGKSPLPSVRDGDQSKPHCLPSLS